jgi:hypothetical protein
MRRRLAFALWRCLLLGHDVFRGHCHRFKIIATTNDDGRLNVICIARHPRMQGWNIGIALPVASLKERAPATN